MKLYADRLSRALAAVYPGDSVTDFVQDEHFGRLTGIGAVDRRVDRYFRIPNRAAALQGTVNHIVDHAESHLLNHLDVEKTVVTCHDIVPTMLWMSGIRTMSRHHYWMSTRKIKNLRKARFVMTDSEATRRDLVNVYGIDESKTFTVYLGVDECFREEDREECKQWLAETHGVPTERPVLLHVGNNYAYKNVDGLLRELALLKEECWTFVKVGPPFTPAQESIIQASGLGNRVFRIDWISEDDLRRVYNGSDLLLHPSLYEGFGWPLLEAMACGTPAVCSDRGSLEETAGDSACIVDPEREGDLAQAVSALLGDPIRRGELAARGRSHVAQFSWDRCARQTYEVYKQVLN